MARKPKAGDAVAIDGEDYVLAGENAHLEGSDSEEAPVHAEHADTVVPAASSGEPALVLLLCDNVYLPDDLLADDWQTATVTRRYEGKTDGKRTRVTCHPGLAAFLQERGQGEIL